MCSGSKKCSVCGKDFFAVGIEKELCDLCKEAKRRYIEENEDRRRKIKFGNDGKTWPGVKKEREVDDLGNKKWTCQYESRRNGFDMGKIFQDITERAGKREDLNKRWSQSRPRLLGFVTSV